MPDIAQAIADQISAAIAKKTALTIVGAGSRGFLGCQVSGTAQSLNVSGHSGIVEYDPGELVITARAGTSLAEIEAELAAAGQMLAFEPPRFSDDSTLGGVIASGLSGPRRAYAGAVRDFILGCHIINGKSETLRFGGQVMKNVAGYDVSRLMVGAFGTLGVLLEISLKVLPKPAASLTLVHERTAEQALLQMRELARMPIPVDASCHLDGMLYLRLSGCNEAVSTMKNRLGGELLADDAVFWQQLRDLQLPFFANGQPLWRLSLPAATSVLSLHGPCLIEWGGAQRWLRADADASTVRDMAEKAGGHATLIRGAQETGAFHPMPSGLLALHQNLKLAFDPHRIFNPGKLYPEL